MLNVVVFPAPNGRGTKGLSDNHRSKRKSSEVWSSHNEIPCQVDTEVSSEYRRLLQAIRLNGYASLYKASWSDVIGWYSVV